MNTTRKDELILISHTLCPYVQRVVSILEETGNAYQRIDIDLNNKPDWFLKLSPLGKVPVLVVNDDIVLFESAVISEYINDINDINGNTLLSIDPLQRAQQKAWIELASSSLGNIARIYNATDQIEYSQQKNNFINRLAHLEENLPSSSFFNNESFSMVDAAFAPIFRYVDLFETLVNFNFMQHFPKIQKWRKLLAQHDSIVKAVRADYPELLLQFIAKRNSFLGERARMALPNDVEKFAMLGGN